APPGPGPRRGWAPPERGGPRGRAGRGPCPHPGRPMCRRFVAARLLREDGRDRRGPSGPPEIRLCPAVGRQHERYGSIRLEHDTQAGSESPLLDREVFAAEHSAEGLVQTSTDVWRCRRRDVGTATRTRIAVERELRDD